MTVPPVHDAGAAIRSADPVRDPAPPAVSPSMPPTTSKPVGARMNVRAIFDDHFDFVWRSLRRLGIAEADADDALQEVFMVVHRKLPEFAGRSKMSTWLYGICFRVASERHRRPVARYEHTTDAMPDQVDPAASPEERYQGREARAKLDEVLAHLDTEKRAVFVLYEIDEIAVEVIAEAIDVPVGTVYSRLKSAREEFDKALSRLRIKWAREAKGDR